MSQIVVERSGRVVTLRPRGNLVGGVETEELKKLVRELVEQGNECLVVNLKATEFMNSMALEALVASHVVCSKRGARLKLCNLDQRVKQLLKITGLGKVLEVHESLDDAITSCA